MKIDIYPVGWLSVLLGLRRAFNPTVPYPAPAKVRIHALRAVRYELRTNIRQVKHGKWRALKNTFNGYLAEPTPFPAGVRRCGSGWTKRRARRSLDRQLATVATSPSLSDGGDVR